MSEPQQPERYRILIIEDDARTRARLARVISGTLGGAVSAEECVHAPSDHEAREAVAAQNGAPPVAVALVDVDAERERIRLVQDLMTTDEDLHVIAVSCTPPKAGHALVTNTATDDRVILLRRPFDDAEVGQLARMLIGKWQLTRAAKRQLRRLEDAVRARTVQLREANDLLQREVAERKEAERRLRHHAFHDPLTGLANRELLIDRLKRGISLARRDPSQHFAVIFLDIDNFKVINDSLGHDAGDDLLVAVTKRLEATLRGADLVTRDTDSTAVRFGGDEFVLLLEHLAKLSDVAVVCKRLLERLTPPFELNGHQVVITASIGVALSNANYDRPDELLRDADIAMYRSKAAGKARYTIFDPEMHSEAIERLQLESDLRRAVDPASGELRLVFQPLVALGTGRISGFEALVRWEHPQRGRISPDCFVPIAEETGLIVPLGQWVLNEACRQLRAWDDTAPDDRRFTMNINLSRRQLLEPSLCNEVADCLDRHGLDGGRVNLEITESATIENIEEAERQLRMLKKLGVGIHMDDFGTGYSSLSCLHRFPLDVVKIDRAFMNAIAEDRSYAAVVHGIITIAHILNMRVTAEGVETQDQLAQILALDCDYAQGYFFSPPLDPDAALEVISREGCWQMPA